MREKGAGGYYSFSEDFFFNHLEKLGSNCELATVHDPIRGNIIAAAFFLVDETGWVHYHLSASQRESMKMQPVELLMAEAILRYGQAGYTKLHLGGGHKVDESDGLSRFKKKFSTESKRFHISRWVCDPEAYYAQRDRLPLKNPSCFLINDARAELSTRSGLEKLGFQPR